jgi:hypothetical protein
VRSKFFSPAAITVVLFAFSTGAQVSLQGGGSIGVGFFKEEISLFGVNSVTDTRTGFTGGFAMDAIFSEYLSLREGIEYSGLGGSAGALADQLNYVALPIAVKLSYPLSSRIHPYLLGGGNFGFLINARLENGSAATDESTFYNAADFGIYCGAGADFPMTHSMVPFVEFSYLLGLSNTSALSSYTQTNRGFQINAGLKVKIK